MSESDFQKTLDMYKTNLVQYKVSGNTAFKTAADTAKKWLDDYMADLESSVNKNGQDIKDFVESRAKSDQEIAKLKKDMASIRKEGPELQMIYETEREAQKEEPVDYTIYYTKGAVLAGIAGLVVVASMF
jgi:chromosome segregation ATPase